MPYQKPQYGSKGHKKETRHHFANRWRDRIECEPPDYDELCQKFEKAFRGNGDGTLVLIRMVGYHSTEWQMIHDGQPVRIRFNQQLRQPITCWKEHPPQLPLETPTTVA